MCIRDRAQCSAVPAPGTPTATDNCDPTVSISLNTSSTQTSNGSCTDNSYTITRTWTATDNCSNTTTASQTITVVDNTAPVFTYVPANTTAQCSAVPAPGTPTATDNCDPTVSISLNTSSTQTSNGSCTDNSYTITRTWTATDNCSNTTTASQTITVVDNTAPVFTYVPANTTAQCSAVPAPGTPTATDNCDPTVSISLSTSSTQPSNGSCTDNSYTITRTWTATDNCSNTTTASQTITVVDNTAPVLSYVPANTIQQCSAGRAPGTLTATDNCDPTV